MAKFPDGIPIPDDTTTPPVVVPWVEIGTPEEEERLNQEWNASIREAEEYRIMKRGGPKK